MLWEKGNHDLYRFVLSGLQLVIPTEALSCCSVGCKEHSDDLETYYLDLIKCLQEAANNVIPKVKGNFQQEGWLSPTERASAG